MRNLKLLDGLALAALLALAIAWASLPLTHDDLFGHLRTGEHIVDHGRVPLTDPFSFTRPGASSAARLKIRREGWPWMRTATPGSPATPTLPIFR